MTPFSPSSRNAVPLLSPPVIHVFIIEPDSSIAQAVAALAVEVIPVEAEALIAKSTTVAGAKRLLERVQPDPNAIVIVVCASEFPDGTSGVEVLTHVRAKHPLARVVLMTNGERDAFVTVIAEHIDGFVTKDNPLAPLRAILQYLGQDVRPTVVSIEDVAAPAPQRAEFQRAVLAMSSALEAVERAHDALSHADDDQSRAARESLRDAEMLAVVAHRRMLDAERRLRAQQA